MKKLILVGLLMLITSVLAGCLFPNEKRVENQIPYPDQIHAVQQAVNQFQQDTGVLPIKTRDMETPIYQKYPIDFAKLVPRYIQQPPGNSFENGGVYQYVLVNVEEAPEVKLIDLTVMKEIQLLQSNLNQYLRKNDLAPIDEMVDLGLFTLRYEELGYSSPPRVRSPYFGNYLPLLIDNSGQILIDYKMDINMVLQEYELDLEQGEDIRYILVDHFPFVPAFSIPYTLDENNDPTYFMDLVYGRN